MGDRGNIVIEEEGQPVLFLYTHWSGSELPEIVSTALKRGRSRWGDDPYLNRVLFCAMVEGDAPDATTGYGIDIREGDGGTEVYIDHRKQRVRYDGNEFSFEEFIERY